MLLRHVFWELEDIAHIYDEEPWLQSPQGLQKSIPCPGQTQGFVAKAFLGACELSMETDPQWQKLEEASKSWQRCWQGEAASMKLDQESQESPIIQPRATATRQSIFLACLATWSRNIKHYITRLLYLEKYFRSTVYWTRASWARLGGRLVVDSYRDSKLLGIGRERHT